MIDDALLTKIAKEMYGVLKRDLHHPKEWDDLSPDKQEINKRAAQTAIDTFLLYMKDNHGKEREK